MAIGSPVVSRADADPSQSSDLRLQSTYVWQRKPAFAADYSGDNSLLASREPRSYSLTATAFVGLRLAPGSEVYFDPEMALSQPLSDLHGLGGMTNGEAEKGGSANPTFYRARLFLRQTWGLDGDSETVDSAPNQLAGAVPRNRLVLTAGNLAVADIFDNNAYAHDARTQFLNGALMAQGAYDYAADTRGYTWGAALEYYLDHWTLRAGRFEQPIESNGFSLDRRILHHYGDQAELEHCHEIAGRAGSLRLLLFHDRAIMGGFLDAVAAWRDAGMNGVPDVGAVRHERNKYGWGVNIDQAVTDDLGAFLRAGANDGRSETYAFTEVERSLSGGLSLKGSRWGRPGDTVGIGAVVNGLSSAHREYLADGGLGAFIGDGAPPAGMRFRYATEQIIETYYSAALARHVAISADYQHIRNPAYNAGRGPASVYGARLHVEY